MANSKLKKNLKLLDVFCIASGAMISSGLFILPGIAHARAGSAVVLSYLIAGLLAMTGMLSQAEIISAMPKAGGDYFYINRTMGPAVGTVGGIMTWISLCLKTSFALIGMAAFTAFIIDLDIRIIGIVLCIVFFLINLIGVKEAARLQIFLVLGLFIILISYIIFGIPYMHVKNLENFAPNGIGSIFATSGFVFVSYGGLLKIASIAEEVDEPAKTVPLGMIFSLLAVTILYVLVVLVTSGILGNSVINNSMTPISDGANIFWGYPGQIILSIAAMLAFISTANAGVMSSARYPFAMSRDSLIPEIFGKTHKRFNTPYTALAISCLFIISTLFFKLEILVKMASTVLFLAFVFSCLCVIVLRESRIQNYQPKFQTPLYPWVQIIGIIGSIFLIVEMGLAAVFASSILIIAGLSIYCFYGSIRTNKEYALLHLVERITDRELTKRGLEDELKEIIMQRDEIKEDKFDKLINNAYVLDCDKRLDLDSLFKILSSQASKELDISEKKIYNKLYKREGESTTAISPTLAIPHIIVDGQHKFTIILARCKKGIKFSESAKSIKTVFLLIGTKDERNFHLRALSAIAQIVQDKNFEKNWMNAKNIEGLKDAVLLAKRKRVR
ncbi:MAG: amino acid permease [Victivallales bacterium]|nr:amino acid permease [Victivallales bacterium]